MNNKLKDPKIMYKASIFGDYVIHKRDVIKETDSSVWYERERFHDGHKIVERELKSTTYHKWFDTSDEANEHVMFVLRTQIKAFEARVSNAKGKLKAFTKQINYK